MPVTNIMLTFRIVFGGVDTTKVTLADEWSLGLKKLDPGPANSLRFYLYSTLPEFIQIAMPPRMTAEPLNTRMSYEVNLSAKPHVEVLFPVTEPLTYP